MLTLLLGPLVSSEDVLLTWLISDTSKLTYIFRRKQTETRKFVLHFLEHHVKLLPIFLAAISDLTQNCFFAFDIYIPVHGTSISLGDHPLLPIRFLSALSLFSMFFFWSFSLLKQKDQLRFFCYKICLHV